MLIDVVWDKPEKTVLRFVRHPGWSAKDYHAAIDQAVEMAQTVPYRVHMIQDSTRTTEMPPNALQHFRIGNAKLAPYSGKSIIVGDSYLMKTLFDMFKVMEIDMSEHFTFVTHIDKARDLLAEEPNPLRDQQTNH
ncbi:MAG: hypothetical protein AAF125_02550 [Chloroflexota bacterium]